MKLGMIGSGLIVQEFRPKLVRLDGVEVAAVQGTPRSKEQVEELCRANGVPNAVTSFIEGTDGYITPPRRIYGRDGLQRDLTRRPPFQAARWS